MSRLRTERIAVALCPGRTGIVRGPLWARRAPRPTSVETGSEDWSAALDALADWLVREKASNLSVTVTVSDRWVRLALMPWSEAIVGQAEEEALARACLESAYGDLEGWVLMAEPGRYGRGRVVCALESAFLERLRAIFRVHSMHCRSIRPYFVQATKDALAMLAGKPGVLAVAESDTVALASTRGKGWQSLRGTRDGHDLAASMRRERVLQDVGENASLFLVAPDRYLPEAGEAKRLCAAGISSIAAENMASEAYERSGRMPVDFSNAYWSVGRLAGVLGFATVVAAALWSGWDYADLISQRNEWQLEWQHLHKQNAKTERVPPPGEQARLKAELHLARQVIERLDAPWDDIFETVEGIYNERVTLLRLEPDTTRHEIRLVAEAKDMAAMLDYVRQVRRPSFLVEGYLLEHQINQLDPMHPVRFTILARWAPDSLAGTTPETTAENPVGGTQ